MHVTVPALISCYPDGRPYTREADVEVSLGTLRDLSLDELIERCRIDSPATAGFVKSECLVHLLRERSRDNRDARFNQLYRCLLKRVAKALPRAERQDGDKVLIDAAISEANDAATARFEVIVSLDRQGGKHLDFFEVHFDQAMARLRRSARRPSARNAQREFAIEHDPETGELPTSIERAAGSFDEQDENLFLDPLFRPRLLAAIDSLPTEQKEVITMLMRHMDQQSIATILDCDPRTVRYRRDRAVIQIREFLGVGATT